MYDFAIRRARDTSVRRIQTREARKAKKDWLQEEVVAYEAQKDAAVQRMKFGTVPRFEEAFHTNTGLTGKVLGKKEAPEWTEEQAKFAKDQQWNGQTKFIPTASVWVHANHSGKVGGAGQTGKTGEAIWLTRNDKSAQKYYGGGTSGVVHEYKPKQALKVAILDDYNQIFAPDDQKWAKLFPEIDGVWTGMQTPTNKDASELVVFNRENLQYLQTIPFVED